jgi:hypothetical protein
VTRVAGSAQIIINTEDGICGRAYGYRFLTDIPKGGVLPLIMTVYWKAYDRFNRYWRTLHQRQPRRRKDYLLRPSFEAMTRIGTPEEIVQAYATIHGNDVAQLIEVCAGTLGVS